MHPNVKKTWKQGINSEFLLTEWMNEMKLTETSIEKISIYESFQLPSLFLFFSTLYQTFWRVL